MASTNRERLVGDVVRALGLNPSVNLDNVRVRVVEGVAVLQGAVGTLEEKEAAGLAASRVGGIRHVENRLAVAANHGTTDRRVTEALDTALDALPGDRHRSIGAVAVDGIAHLHGHATSAAEVETARQAALGVEGVKDVIDEVRIDAGAPMDEASVSNRVIQALVQSGAVTPLAIQVTAVGGDIVLRGAVASTQERQRAAAIAMTVAGVAQVDNRLSVRHDMGGPH
jgi:osmotically-inducible protein OsmY